MIVLITGIFYDNYCKKKLDIVKQFLNKNDTILDIGCGNPEQSYCIRELMKYPKWVGFDRNPVDTNRIIKGDINKIDIADNSFDVVLCLDVIEHFKDPKTIVEKLIKISKKKIIIITPITKYKFFRKFINIIRYVLGVGILSGHYYEFFEHEIEEMAKGSTIIEKKYIEFPLPYISKLLYKLNFVKSGIFILEKDNN